ncbi:MAG: DUF2130 domain-containing protein [Bacillota bacterium]|nr:DUF2130 domain-containing protein [Bacillota bacterium]
MTENRIQCPHCGQSYALDDVGYASIVKQVRDIEFQKDVQFQLSLLESKMRAEQESELQKMQFTLKEQTIESERKIAQITSQSELNLAKLQSQLETQETKHQLAEQTLRQSYEVQLSAKEEQIAYYRDFKAKQSTKMIGESLEQYCMNQFNQLRMTAFPNVYFEKDNKVSKSGSKGDFIYRESVEDVEFLSIMFEMKNETDTTATKHKNEDFFKELDKDRKEKNCEYAILVSMLESDSDFYNTGIVDVSYRYPKMYVIRPQFFIQMITILRNAAMNALDARRELLHMQQMQVDVTNFEENLLAYQENVAKNYQLASRQFEDAIAEIDKSIEHLQKVKSSLQSSERNLRLMNDKVDGLTIRKLTKDSPSVAQLLRK